MTGRFNPKQWRSHYAPSIIKLFLALAVAEIFIFAFLASSRIGVIR